MHVRTTSSELARWLEEQGGEWHVEGELMLARSLPLPTTARSLVEVLRKRSDAISLLAPDESAFAEGGFVSADQLARAAHLIEGERVFQLAWIRPDGTAADSWLLAEQRAQKTRADDGAAARGVVAAFRASVAMRRG
jgi:hypothetical protein